MSAVTQELFDRINSLDEQQQQLVLDFVRDMTRSTSERSALLRQFLVEAEESRRKTREKYGENHYFNSQDLLDELREEESY